MANAIKKTWKAIEENYKAVPKKSRHDFIIFGLLPAILFALSLWWLDCWPYKPLLEWLRQYFPYTRIPHQHAPYFRGYVFSVFAGAFFTFCFSELLHLWVRCRYRSDPDAIISRAKHKRARLVAFLNGVVERAIITTLVGFEVAGAAGFIGGWVAMKGLGLYASSTGPSSYERMRVFVALLNGAVSILFGIIGGLIIADP